jgi:GNAT superfamily N-acetyltransferase
MTEPDRLPLLDRGALSEISALCERGVKNPPTIEELDGALFAPDEPVTVRGNPAVGVVASVESEDGAHVRLLVVEPSARGRGHGHTLLETAEADARAGGHSSLTIGADPAYFLWPGAPAYETALLSLLERHHYSRVEINFDMSVDLGTVPPDPGGHTLATAAERDEVDAWMAVHWPNWHREVLRALDKGNLLISRDDPGGGVDVSPENPRGGDIAAFCAFEVNRTGLLGPVAVRPDLLGRGRGRGVLLGALHELRRRGRGTIDVVWVGPVVPYASVGGVVSNVYFVYRRQLS